MYAIRSYYVEVGLHAHQQFHAEFLVCHLPAAKTQRHLGAIAFTEKLDQLAQLDLVVVITSYSIHYTKLYEEAEADPGQGNQIPARNRYRRLQDQAAQADRVPGGGGPCQGHPEVV